MRLIATWILFFTLLMPQGSVLAENGMSRCPRLAETRDTLFQDYKNYYSRRNLGMVGLGLGVAGLVANTNADQEIRDHYQRYWRNDTTDSIAERAENLGNGFVCCSLYAAGALVGELAGGTAAGSAVGDWGRRSLRTLLVGVPPLLVFQKAVGASRPEEGKSDWKLFDDNNGVSGHSFMGAVPLIVAAKMTEKWYWKAPIYTASVVVGLARVNVDAHYFSQIALGWWLAYLAADSVDRTEEVRHDVLITPAYVPGGVGLQIVVGGW